MSDRHLYKAKRTDNGEWVAGCFLIDYITGQYFIHACGNSVNESDKIGEEGCMRFVAFEVDPATLCQCTGLKDKNGRLIWENDMVRRKILGCEVIGIVKWTDIGFTGFKLEVSNKNGSKSFYAIGRGTYDDDMSERCDDEVIGNVFDNLELLEVGE